MRDATRPATTEPTTTSQSEFSPPVVPSDKGTALDDPNDGFRPTRRREADESETIESTSRFAPPGQPSSIPEGPKPRKSQLDLEQINRKLALVTAIDELRKCKRLEFVGHRNEKVSCSNAVRDKLVTILSQRAVLADPNESDYKVAAEAHFDAGEVFVLVAAPGTLNIRRGKQDLAYCHGPEIDRLCEDLTAEDNVRLKSAEVLRRFVE